MARYENFIIENKVNDYLNTKLELSKFLTVDTSLQETDGMVKKVHKYTKSGSAETVSEGSGNTSALAITYTPVSYTVTTTQAKFSYTDEAAMADSFYVDKGVEAIAESIVNEFNDKAIAEWAKTTNVVYTGNNVINYDNFADAIAQLNLEDEDEGKFSALVNPATKAIIRKSLGEDLKYVEAFARTGYIGSVCGIPIYTSKKVAANTVIIAAPEAVTCFMKKSSEIEQSRDADKRTNNIFGRNVKVIALTDESKCVMIKTGSAG
ncbi:MAG: hypothetical protein ACI4PI_03150 [Oscillospiraceae bacterium]